MLWEVDIYPAEGQPDLGARDVASAAAELHIAKNLAVTSARGYLIQGDLDRAQIERIAAELLADRVVERTVAAPVGDPLLTQLPAGRTHWIHVLPKPGVMDPCAKRPDGHRRFRHHGRGGPHAEEICRFRDCCASRPTSRCSARKSWPTTPSSR